MRRFTFRHIAWLAQREGIPLRFPPCHPFNPLRLLRLAVLLDDIVTVQRLFRFVWAEGRSADDSAEWDALIEELGISDADSRIAVPAAKARLRENTETACGEDPHNLNVFSARRGNWEVMIRGLFTNKSVRNLLDSSIPPGCTIDGRSGKLLTLWTVAQRYIEAGDSTVIVASERFGMGSSRDWAAKGIHLLGIRAVLAVSFERIFRSNLIHMGILPLRLPPKWASSKHNLLPGDTIEIDPEQKELAPEARVKVSIHRIDGRAESFFALSAVETSAEIQILAQGGIIPTILQRAVKGCANQQANSDRNEL